MSREIDWRHGRAQRPVKVVDLIRLNPGCTLDQIAETMRMDPGEVRGEIARLMEDGRIQGRDAVNAAGSRVTRWEVVRVKPSAHRQAPAGRSAEHRAPALESYLDSPPEQDKASGFKGFGGEGRENGLAMMAALSKLGGGRALKSDADESSENDIQSAPSIRRAP